MKIFVSYWVTYGDMIKNGVYKFDFYPSSTEDIRKMEEKISNIEYGDGRTIAIINFQTLPLY